MTVLSLLYSLIILPIKLLFEVIFTTANRLTGNIGLSIIILSLTVNLLVLPLYKRADELQAEDRDIQKKMAPMIKHIKKTFKGDERFFMTQEYYRINNYKPIYSLKSSVSLLLQIPFFIAAYDLLSGMSNLQGMSFSFISDLGREDATFYIGSFPVNILPILMTLINVISGILYTKGHPLKAKIQVYGLAAIFLVLLYHSPSGLVFYWLLNNVFSLVKNIIGKLHISKSADKPVNTKLELNKKSFSLVFLSGVVLAVLTGVMVPSDVVVQNAAEMTNTLSADPHNPMMYIVVSAVTAIGLFLIWIPVFCVLTPKAEKVYSLVLPAMASAGVVNYIAFNKNFGFLSNKLIYDYPISYELKEILINLAVVIAVTALVVFITLKWRKTTRLLLVVAFIAVSFLSLMRLIAIGIDTAGYNYSYSNTAEEVSIPLSSTGKNVVVLMIDKMNGQYIPYLFNERPDVAEQFDGFTYYPNTVSFGKFTNTGSPALFGGYDYTPDKINARSNVPLVDKQNEALLTMPVIFLNNGWNVSVVDPSYANYQWKPDLSIYDGYEGINAYHMSGVFNDRVPELADVGADQEARLNRNLFCYGLMKSMPYFMQAAVYDGGNYLCMDLNNKSYRGNSLHIQNGFYEWHLQEHAALNALCEVTEITTDPTNCFFVMSNGSTHEVCLLEEPDYTPALYVDNTDYDAAHEDRFTVDGVTMHMDTHYCNYAAYQCSMEACITLGQWFDYLRENGLYDNTRIIIVADHGYGMGQFDDLLMSDLGFDAQSFNPVLMVKDFNSTGFTVSDEFMTNADTPSLAFEGNVDNPVNPFTNNPINQDVKSGDLLIYSSDEVNIYTNNGTRFEDSNGFWLAVHDDIRDENNWAYIGHDY